MKAPLRLWGMNVICDSKNVKFVLSSNGKNQLRKFYHDFNEKLLLFFFSQWPFCLFKGTASLGWLLCCENCISCFSTFIYFYIWFCYVLIVAKWGLPDMSNSGLHHCQWQEVSHWYMTFRFTIAEFVLFSYI